MEISDPEKFRFDYQTGKNIYSYSLIVPEERASTENIQRMMQQDLERYFGFYGSVEKRMAPYWKLTAIGGAKKKLRAKNTATEPDVVGDYAGKKFINVPIKGLITSLSGLDNDGLVVLDETGIDFNIDIVIDADMTIRDSVWQTLQKQGLILEKAEKLMECLVIKEVRR